MISIIAAILLLLSVAQANAWLVRGGGASGPPVPPPPPPATINAFYVATNGNDSNPGTPDSPLLTLPAAQTAMRGSSTTKTAVLRGGTYTLASGLSFTSSDNGEMWQSYPGEVATVSGGMAITGWSAVGDGSYSASVPSGFNFREFYVNGVHGTRARGPNNPSGWTVVSDGFTAPDGAMSSWGNRSNIEIVWTGKFGIARCHAASISGTPSHVVMSTPCWTNIVTYGAEFGWNGTPTWIDNAKELLSGCGAGCWYLDVTANVVYYIPRAGETLTTLNTTAVAPNLENLISGSGVTNINFNHLAFEYASWLEPDDRVNNEGGYVKTEAGLWSHNTVKSPITFQSGSSGVTFDHNLFTHFGGRNLLFLNGTKNVTITANRGVDNAAGGVQWGDNSDPDEADPALQTSGLIFRDNYFERAFEYIDVGQFFQVFATGSVIDHNEIAGSDYMPMEIGWGWGPASGGGLYTTGGYNANNYITANYIHDYCGVATDCGGLKSIAALGNSLWTDNYLKNGTINTYGGCIYPDMGSTDATYRRNVCDTNAVWLFFFTTVNTGNIVLSDNCTTTSSQDNGGGATIAGTVTFTSGSPPELCADTIANAGIEPGVTTGPAGGATSEQEFVGPFANWACARSSASNTCGAAAAAYCNATGDGSTDDTSALQTCINNLTDSSPVVWVPSGKYKITSQLSMTSKNHGGVIGEDPATTKVSWYGSSGGTMILGNGNEYSRVNRITLDGRSVAAIGIDQADTTGSYFGTGNEYTDDKFENLTSTAFRCGFSTNGCSEVSLIRDQFIAGSPGAMTGINICNFNALDIWIWYSVFRDQYRGVSNDCGAGNFRTYDSEFFNSTDADLYNANANMFTAIGDYSINANKFIQGGGSNNAAVWDIIGNTVVDPGTFAIMNGFGPLILAANKVRKSSAPIVTVDGGFAGYGELFSYGNTFTSGTAQAGGTTTCGSALSFTGRCHESADQIVSSGALDVTEPSLPPTLPNNHRAIFEARSTGSGTTCSGAAPCSITQAASSAAAAGNKAVAHLQAGSYTLSATLAPAANSDIQIIGDGYNGGTALTWGISAAAGEPLLQLIGPSKVTLVEFDCQGSVTAGNNIGDCIQVTNADQLGSRIYMEQVIASQSQTHDIFVDALDNTLVEGHSVSSGGGSSLTAGNGSLMVTGGSSTASGNWPGGRTNIFSNNQGGDYTVLKSSGGAHIMMQGDRLDASGSGPTALYDKVDLTGQYGFVSWLGSELNTISGTDTDTLLHDWRGTLAIVGSFTIGLTTVSGSGSGANNLFEGLINQYSDSLLSDSASPADTHWLINSQIQCVSPCSGSGSQRTAELPDGSPTPAFLDTTLAEINSVRPLVNRPALAAGVTDVQMYRLGVSGASGSGIHLVH